jgi:hypothetical protein
MRAQAAMSIVIADSVGGAEIAHPSGLQQRDQPGLMLPGNGDRARYGEGQRTSHADRLVQNGVDTPQERPAERGETMRNKLMERFAFIDAANFYAPVSVGMFHLGLFKLPTEGLELLFELIDFTFQGYDTVRDVRPRNRRWSAIGFRCRFWLITRLST